MLRVLYFTIVAQSEIANGGAISSRTTIRRLKEDDNIDLAVVIAGTESARTPTVSYLTDIGIDKFLFIPFEMRKRPSRFRERIEHGWIKLAGFPGEALAAMNPHVKQCVLDSLNRWQSDYLVMDFLFTALFCPDLDSFKLPTAVVTMNREAEFYRDSVALRALRHGSIKAAIVGSRLARFRAENLFAIRKGHCDRPAGRAGLSAIFASLLHHALFGRGGGAVDLHGFQNRIFCRKHRSLSKPSGDRIHRKATCSLHCSASR